MLATGYELTDMRAARRPPGHLDLGDRDAAAAATLLAGRGLHLGSSDPYLYMRATADGRVICGGEDEEFTDEALRDALIADKTARIAEKLGKLFPQLDTTPNSPGPAPSARRPPACPISARSRGIRASTR